MKAKEVKNQDDKHYGVAFKCPGCGFTHVLPTQHTPQEVTNAPRWQWNDSYEKPVFSPSVLSRYDKYSEARRNQALAVYQQTGNYPTLAELPYDVHYICHSFVGCNGAQPGQIIFLGDCTHALAGQTVDLPEMKEDGAYDADD